MPKICLHCGWMKTGTTSLQAGLARHQTQLRSAGVLYPEYGRGGGDNHDFLFNWLSDGPGFDGRLDTITRFLESRADQTILLCAESLTAWAVRPERHERLLRVLEAFQDVAPVRCVWTLRRADEAVTSLYLHMMLGSMERKPAARFMADFSINNLFTGMRKVQDAVGGEVACVRYRHDSSHNTELLREFGVPGGLAGEIGRSLDGSTRLNTGLRQKEIAAVLNHDAISSRLRLRLRLDKWTLIDAFRGGFRFDDDRPFVVTGPRTRRELHQRALDAAGRTGVGSYVRFFHDEDLGELPPVTPAHVSVLTDDDLRRLAAHFVERPTEPGGMYVEPLVPR